MRMVLVSDAPFLLADAAVFRETSYWIRNAEIGEGD
jgi:hypothetical protein